MDIEMNIEMAKERLKLCSTNQCNICGRYEKEECMLERNRCERTVLLELEKKDKVIDEMSKYVNSPLRIPEEEYCEFYHSDEDCCWKTDKDCKDCIKEYFANKVEQK